MTWKKVENNNFIWAPLQGANIFQIFSVIIFFKEYLEPDLLGNIQLVPQLPLGGHCNLSEIIKTQENVKGESNMWKKVKLNEQGTPNISSEISLSFENGSESSQFGQILKSELYWRAKPIVQCVFGSFGASNLRTQMKTHSGKNQTNATSVTIHRFGRTILGHNWNHTLDTSLKMYYVWSCHH